jgi:1-acyl-sn-glycerol-3-phosphate acyltransferase
MIRGILVLLPVLLWTLISGILGIFLRLFFPAGRVILFIAHRFWSPVILFLFDIRITVKRRPTVMPSRAIFIANHASQIDIAIVVRVIQRGLFFIAKKELKKVPLLGQYIQVMGMVFIDRKNKESAIASMDQAASMIQGGKNIVAFPEGTRSKDETLLPFKKGSFVIAQRANIPLIPIAIQGASTVLPKGSLLGRPGKINVWIGDPIFPADYPSASPGQLADAAHQKMKEALQHLQS